MSDIVNRKYRIQLANQAFDKTHYLIKKRRSIRSLYKTLLFLTKIYRDDMKYLQKDLSKLSGKKVSLKIHEYVACTIAAKSKKIGVFGTSFQLLNISQYNRFLLKELKKLGSIGSKSSVNSDNIIGKCAEVKAANNILINDKRATITDIQFSDAIRPRTLEVIARCSNCKNIFGDE